MAIRNHGIYKLGFVESLDADWIIVKNDEEDQEEVCIKGAQVPVWILGTERLMHENQIVVANQLKKKNKSVVVPDKIWTMQIGSQNRNRIVN